MKSHNFDFPFFDNKKILILGAGFTGTRLKKLLISNLKEPSSVKLSSRSVGQDIVFHLNDQKTWKNLPKSDYTFWTFPPTPLHLVRSFYEEKKSLLGKTLVIGSTGGFQVERDGELVNEKTLLDLTQERVQGEESLRSSGAMILRASGIVGPSRNPLNWLREGRVSPSDKLINLIHVDDLCSLLIHCMRQFEEGEQLIASAKETLSWSELFEEINKHIKIRLPQTSHSSSKRTSKRIDSRLTLNKLGFKHQYSTLLDICLGIEKDERG